MKQYPLSGYTCSVVFYVESDLASTPLLKWRHPGLQRRGGVGVLSWTQDWSELGGKDTHGQTDRSSGLQTQCVDKGSELDLGLDLEGRTPSLQRQWGGGILSWTWGWTLGGGHPCLQRQYVCGEGAHSELDLGLDPRRGTLQL